MPSSYTTRSRFVLQATGEGTNIWGTVLNAGAFALIDTAMDGITTVSAAGATTLTTANGAADQARARMLFMTSASAQALTIPSVEKWYLARNTGSVNKTIGPSGGTQATVYAGETVPILTDGVNAYRMNLKYVDAPTQNYHPASKQYADNLAFTANAGILPGQTGNEGNYLKSDGTVAGWAPITIADVTDYASDQSTKTATATGLAIAFAVAL